MNRPDLMTLSEEDLVRASNAGIVKRARRELESLTATISEEADVILTWSDSVTCRFPPASSFRGQCSCPAKDICRHLVRSILYLQTHADSTESTTPSAPTSSKEPVVDVDSLLQADEAELTKHLGKAVLTRARKSLANNLVGSISDRDRRSVTFPQLGVEIRFPAGASLASAICSCHEHPPCSHLIPALLILRGESTPTAPPLSRAEDAAVRQAMSRTRELLEELIRVGMDGLSPAWTEAVRATALEIEKAGLNIPADLLNVLNGQVEAELTRDRPFHPDLFRSTLAKLWVRIEAIARQSELAGGSDDLINRARGQYWTVGAKRLVGVGIRAWQTEEITGISVYLLDEESGDIVSTGTGRPTENGTSPLYLAGRVPLLGENSARDMLGRHVECTSARLTGKGKILLGEGARCIIYPAPVDWALLLQRFAITRWSNLADRLREEYPSLLSHRRDNIYLFQPSSFGTAAINQVDQSFTWPMIDADGRTLFIEYSYSDMRAVAFEQLKDFPADNEVIAVLGTLRFRSGSALIEPITFLRRQGQRIAPFVVDLDQIKARSL